MESRHCLNCHEEITKKFCPNCGQKADTHRITFKRFIAHDLLHGTFHLDRGILFTLKETLLRPGNAALDYIGGKRIRYYNIFYLCLLTIGVHILLVHLYDIINPERIKTQGNDVEIVDFFSRYLKVILLGIVPIIALDAWLFFRKLKLNLAEHFILSGINLLGMLIIGVFFSIFNFLNEFAYYMIFGWLEVLCFFMILLYPAWTYLNAGWRHYSAFGLLWRTVAFCLVIYMQMLALLMLIFWIVTKNTQVAISM